MRVDWYPDRDPRLGPGVKNVEHSVTYSVSVASALIRYSTALAREASQILEMTHHRSGEERAEIGVVHNTGTAHEYSPELDSIVYLQAPDVREGDEDDKKSKKAAEAHAYAAVQSIEFGHFTRGENPRWVEGVSPLRKAAKKMARNPKLSIK